VCSGGRVSAGPWRGSMLGATYCARYLAVGILAPVLCRVLGLTLPLFCRGYAPLGCPGGGGWVQGYFGAGYFAGARVNAGAVWQGIRAAGAALGVAGGLGGILGPVAL